jgi:endonuclease/exonuclease/phosphatase family metal-dependent hydrolase
MEHPAPDEPRLGGRVAVAADMKVGRQLLRLYSLHLESTVQTLRIRDAQAIEIAEDALPASHPVIAGGDLNAYLAIYDFTTGGMQDGPTQAFLTRGFLDAHALLPIDDRPTIFDPGPLIIDFLFTRGVRQLEAGLCQREVCGDLSDHLPVWATIELPEP